MSKNAILTYSQTTNTLGQLDGTRIMQFPLQGFQFDAEKSLLLTEVHFSKYIANVFNVTSPIVYNNTRLLASTDNGATWFELVLTTGKYDIDTFNAAIKSLTSTLWTDPEDPGIVFGANPSTGRIYLQLDSTKLNAAGTLGVKLDATASQDVAEFLGFTGQKTFLGNNVWEAVDGAMFNLTGDSINIIVDGFGPLAFTDGKLSQVIASVPMILHSAASNEFVYPLTPVIPPRIVLTQCPSVISQFGIRFESTRSILRNGILTKLPVLFIEGGCYVALEFRW